MSIFPEWIGPQGTGDGIVINKITVIGGELHIDFADDEELNIEFVDDSFEVRIEDEPITIEL
jgi:hypothetical protein